MPRAEKKSYETNHLSCHKNCLWVMGLSFFLRIVGAHIMSFTFFWEVHWNDLRLPDPPLSHDIMGCVFVAKLFSSPTEANGPSHPKSKLCMNTWPFIWEESDLNTYKTKVIENHCFFRFVSSGLCNVFDDLSVSTFCLSSILLSI